MLLAAADDGCPGANEIVAPCKVHQRLYWPGYPGLTSDKTDFHDSTSRTTVCTQQTHARVWDDQEHARLTGAHGAEDQWVVGGIHHEVPAITPTGLKHRINRDWDLVRLSLVKAMHAHCST